MINQNPCMQTLNYTSFLFILYIKESKYLKVRFYQELTFQSSLQG